MRTSAKDIPKLIDKLVQLWFIPASSLNPASFLKPDAGEPKTPRRLTRRGRGERNRAAGFKATFKAKPDS
jgi:hypothetical protein